MAEELTPVFHSMNSSFEQADHLSALWQKIERYELRNKKAELKIDQLYAEYERIVAPYEKKLGDSKCAWVEHLISFLNAKDLKKTNRMFLMQLIELELDHLYQLASFCDMDRVRALCNEYEVHHDKMYKKEKQRAINQACNEFENYFKSIFGEDVDLPKEKVRTAFETGNPDEINALLNSLQESIFEKNDETFAESEQQENEWSDFEFNYYYGEEEDEFNVKEMFRGTQLNKMYKRIANVIHPDKESDPLKKEEKHQLMQDLAVAKKNNDVVTLVRMFSKYVPDANCLLDDETMVRIEHLLAMQLRELNQAHRDLFKHQGLKSMVWQTFSAPSKKKIQEKMQEKVSLAQDIIASLNKDIHRINGVKKLNRYLKNRFIPIC